MREGTWSGWVGMLPCYHLIPIPLAIAGPSAETETETGLDVRRSHKYFLLSCLFQDPNLNALASRHFRNHDGVVKVLRPSGDGHICEVALQAKQVG